MDFQIRLAGSVTCGKRCCLSRRLSLIQKKGIMISVAPVELETLGPRTKLKPGEALTHQETWLVYDQVVTALSNESINDLVGEFGLGPNSSGDGTL